MNLHRILRTAAGTGLLLATTGALASADFTVNGSVHYVDKEFTFNAGFTGVEPERPVRFAVVRVVDAATDQTLAAGATDQNGDFSLAVVGTGQKDILVRVIARSSAFGPTIRVTDDNQQNYTMVSPTFADWDQTVDLDIGTLVSPIVLAAGREGNPFNLLDQLVDGIQWVQSVGAGALPQTLRVQWPSGGTSSALNTVAFIADDDGYDDVVVLHELGHVMHNVFSDNDQDGGVHFFGESNQEPKLSFGEGWASAFAGAVRRFRGDPDPGFYLDASGLGSTGPGTIQVRLRYEDAFPFATTTEGEADEGAIACSIWDLVDDAQTPGFGAGGDDDPVDGSFLFSGGLSGEELVWRSLDGPVELADNSNVNDLWNGLFSPGPPGADQALVDVFDFWRIRFRPDADEFDGDFASATPLVTDGNWSDLHTLYAPAPGTAAPGEGDSDFFRLTVPDGLGFVVETRYPDGQVDAGTWVDPFIQIYRPDGTPFVSDDDSGVGRNAKVSGIADVGGEWFAEVRSVHPFRVTGSYELRAILTGLDCNGNGTADEIDIAQGASLDLDGNGVPDECQPLSADTLSVSLAFGGTQNLVLDAGPGFANSAYLLLGTTSGTSPGFLLDGTLVPLNIDGYTELTLVDMAGSPLVGSFGLLDGQGRAGAQFTLPPGLPIALLGVVANHAFIALGPTFGVDFASNAIPVATSLF